MSIPRRLLWRCRRGVKELDLLLTGYLERQFDSMDDQALADFEALLECSDPDLLDWLTGRREPELEALGRMVAAIRGIADP
jgi:antitoxin CptB